MKTDYSEIMDTCIKNGYIVSKHEIKRLLEDNEQRSRPAVKKSLDHFFKRQEPLLKVLGKCQARDYDVTLHFFTNFYKELDEYLLVLEPGLHGPYKRWSAALMLANLPQELYWNLISLLDTPLFQQKIDRIEILQKLKETT